jgi:DNA-binding transcriptional LysR family regulator
VAPRLEEIEAELAAVSELGGKPAGTIRITAIDYAAFVPEDLARPHVEAGRSRYVLEDWFPTFPGLHVYYPSRRQSSRALALVVDALRHRH